MRALISRIKNGSAVLWWSGVVCVALTALFGVMALLDPFVITGVRRWIKPAKFCISFVLYFWTLAWMLPVLLRSEKLRRVVAVSGVGIMAIELIAIVLQAARGVTSHFNNSSVLNAAVYAVMGMAISINTVILLLLAIFATFAWKPAFDTDASGGVKYSPVQSGLLLSISSSAERTGIICGLWLIVVGSVFGILISLHGGHSIGVAEDAAGLPLVGWKRAGGDLRVSHFLGLHGFQMAPLVGLVTRSSLAVYAMSVLWTLAVIFLFRSAMSGASVWPL